ncbi:phytoene/squalene synthase family protein [Rubritalea marina]|uniref:phytoene/squalene synthase family protein n=1 Tax=Rubritalea marina TaxID=361055 RepID=UPI000381799C|nr:squalene/phytoene synthase family protein [Rubritalea marina]
MPVPSDLGKSVLKGVSRSFYLTIRLLPPKMRQPIALGYLLARASDTIADTAAVPAELREDCLYRFTHALGDQAERVKLQQLLENDFIHYQSNEKEQQLLQRMADVFTWYDQVPSWQRESIDRVLGFICRGQMQDIRHFSIESQSVLSSSKALESYCFHVAGCVGEFWSEIGIQSMYRFSRLEPEELKELGGDYGIGLQLVNILRDIPEDFANGRCYLPVADMNDKQLILDEAERWRARARDYVESGLAYSSSLRSWRCKVATVLPALIARETLDLLEEASWEDLEAGVKVSRKVVRQCLWRALWWD